MNEQDQPPSNEAPYDVGYGKPPERSRFKPGQSGNPRGKKKGAKSYKSVVKSALNEKITVRTPRGPRKMTKLQAMFQTVLNNALKGDPKAVDQVLRTAREVGMADEIAETLSAANVRELAEEDRAILDRFREPEFSLDRSEDD